MRSFLTLLLALAVWCAGGAPIGAGGLRAEAAPHPGYAARKVARSKKSVRRKVTRRTTRARATRTKATRAKTTRAKANRKARRGSSRRATKRRTTRRKAVVTQRRAGRGARRGTPRRASASRATRRKAATRRKTARRATKRTATRATAKRGAVNRRTAAKRTVGKRTVGKRTAAAKRAAAAKRKTSPKVVVTLRKPTAPRGADVASQAAAAASAPSVGGTPGSVEPELLLVTARAMEEGRIVTRRPWNCVPDRLKAVLGQIAERWGTVTVNSSHRTLAHNRRVGGKPRSFHLKCQAADFSVKGSHKGLVAFLKDHPLVGGYKRYRAGHFHIDVGPKRTW